MKMKNKHFITLIIIGVITLQLPLIAGKFKLAEEGEYSSTELTDTINTQLRDITADLNERDIVKLTGNQDKFALGNSLATSANVLSGVMFSGLDATFASFSFAGGISAQDPNNLEDLQGNIKNGNDSEVGFSTGGYTLYSAINSDVIEYIPLKGLVFEAQIGLYDTDNLFDTTDIKYSSFLFGLGARYKIASFPLQNPILKIRSLTIGTSLNYSQSILSYDADPIDESSESTLDDGTTIVRTDSVTTINIKSEQRMVIIPVELVTSIKALYVFNFIAGTGFDLVAGQSKVSATADTDITVFENRVEVDASREPDFELTDSTTDTFPILFRYKMITGFGFEVTHVKIEVPIVYYPTSGFSASFMAGYSF
jgi:hypothetical protein